MSRPKGNHRTPPKDMYWFAHGGIESNAEKCLPQRSLTPGELEEDSGDASSALLKSLSERKGPEEQRASFYLKEPLLPNQVDGGNSSSSFSSLEKEDRVRPPVADRRLAAEERRKQLWEAEQERNDAVLRKHMEREAALEARRNAQRSTISFAFGSAVHKSADTHQGQDSEKANRLQPVYASSRKEEIYELNRESRSVSPLYGSHYDSVLADGLSPRPTPPLLDTYSERKSMSPPCWLVGSGAVVGEDLMSRSLNASALAPRVRRKNDLTPTVPYDRTGPPRSATVTSSTKKRSVSMTRLDQLAQPRRPYVEANKASSTVSSGASSFHKENVRSPTRPLSSASEQSGGSGHPAGPVTRRPRTSPKKPRPFSIAGTVPDQKVVESKISPIKKCYTPSKKPATSSEARKASTPKATPPSKSVDKPKSTPRVSTPRVSSRPSPPKAATPKQPSPVKALPKTAVAKKTATNKKKADILASSTSSEKANQSSDEQLKTSASPSHSPTPDAESSMESEKNAKRITSEEEAKAALAEKRRLAREQAERDAELERQRQEELRLEEEERLRREEEEQRKMEEEQLHLLEEHRKQEEEKLRKAIEEQERKEEEEKVKREEDQRLKAEQERKAKEEAEKQRLELEEKLRKEEEERAERKKRLEKIMSRTRGKTSGTSPSGSISGSDQLDSSDNQQEGFSSGANSLESNETADLPPHDPAAEANQGKSESSSVGNSLEANPTYEVASETESLNSGDLMMPSSEPESLVMAESGVTETEKHVFGETSHTEHANQNVDELKAAGAFEEKSSEQGDCDLISNIKEPELMSSTLDSLNKEFEDMSVAAPEAKDEVEHLPIADTSSPFEFNENGTNNEFFTHEMKLPDPISDTSSVCSEKQNEADGCQEDKLLEMAAEDDIKVDPVTANPFAMAMPDFQQVNMFEVEQPTHHEMQSNGNPFDLPASTEEITNNENAPASELHNNEATFTSHENDFFQPQVNPFAATDSEQEYHEQTHDLLGSEQQYTTQSETHTKAATDTFLLTSHGDTLPQQHDNFDAFHRASTDIPGFSDVTIIKAEGSGDCVGFISSVENDSSNLVDFPHPDTSNQPLKSNFDYTAVATDSEDSSLDSNLSQVMNVENESQHDDGLKDIEVNESKSNAVLPDSENHGGYLLNVQSIYNGDGVSKASGNHLYAGVTISNGHGVKSDEHVSNEVQLGEVKGNDIPSVDHHRDNIFGNVDTIDFSKVSPDPFLAKGNSGNPFLVQD